MSRGSLVYVPVGTWLCDAAFPPTGWWIDFPGCGRYYSLPTFNRKNLTEAEIAARAQADDAGFMLFVEQGESTPTTGSREANIALADQGTAMALEHGAPPGTPLMFAVDTEARPYMDAVRGNFVLYRQRVPEQFPLWAYAGSDVIDQLVEDGTIESGHIPAALSWSSTTRPVDNDTVFRHPAGFNYYLTPAASMLQYPSESYRGGRIDRNRAIGRRPVPVWYPGREGGPQPQPPGGDMDMNGVIIELRDSWVVLAGIWTRPQDNGQGGRIEGPVRWIDGPTKADRQASGYDTISRSWTELRGMTYLGAVLPQGDGHPAAPSINWDGSQFRDYVINGPAAPVDIAALTAQVTANLIANLQNG